MLARILIIEDHPANRELMGYLLKSFGYTPEVAVDGPSGLAAVMSRPFDLVLCDIHLPGIGGYEIIRHIKTDADRRRVAVVAVTAMAMVGDRDKILAAGFDGYLAKPIEAETFVSDVEAFLPPDCRATR